MIDSIALLNGHKLRCSPKQNRVRPIQDRPLSRETIRVNKRLFYTNVSNFIANTDKILSDSRYFLTSVGYYASIGSTVMPCLGILVSGKTF